MSESREKMIRHNELVAFARAYKAWIECEPSKWHIIDHMRWKRQCPPVPR